MNAAQLQEWLRENPKAAAGVGAAALAGVVVLRRRKSASGSGAATTSGGGPAGGIALTPAGSTFSTGSQLQGVANSSSSDVYNALQPQLEALQNQLDQQNQQDTAPASSSTIPVPPPVASTLFAPTYNGQYVRYAGGGISEVESDGSLFTFTPSQWAQAYKQAGPGGVNVTQLKAKTPPSLFTTEGNLAKRNNPNGAQPIYRTT